MGHFLTLIAAFVLYSLIVLFPSQASVPIPPSPSCAEDCAIAGIPASGCLVTDVNFACYCNSTTFISSLVLCIRHNCSESDQCTAAVVLQSFCSSLNVPLPTLAMEVVPVSGNCPHPTNSTSSNHSVQTSTSTRPVQTMGQTLSITPSTLPPDTVTRVVYSPSTSLAATTQGANTSLSMGGKVGIGVGAGAAVVAALVAATIVFYQRWQRRRGMDAIKPTHELSGDRQVRELPGEQARELPGDDMVGRKLPPGWI